MTIDKSREQSMKIDHVEKVTKFSLIDWSLISNINGLIGIDCYRLISNLIDCSGR